MCVRVGREGAGDDEPVGLDRLIPALELQTDRRCAVVRDEEEVAEETEQREGTDQTMHS